MSRPMLRHVPQLLAGSLCLGLAAANVVRAQTALALVVAALLGSAATASVGPRRLGLLVVALALAGWWWGSARLDALDRSPLTSRLETAARVRVTITGPVRRGKYDVRAPAVVTRFAGRGLREPVQLKLPLGRAPPQGAVLDALVRVTAPRGPENGFDERTWLRRHGVHVVLLVDRWRIVGRRGGLGGVADALRRQLQGSVARGLTGYRAAVLEGVVLGEDSGLSEELRRRFRASGLYHLLAVSGQNVALVAASALLLAWLLGVPRLFGQLGALAAICGYVLAVGAQPSVIRAGVAGALGSLAWLTARTADRWHLLLVGAIVLLAWNPYTLLDAGFQLSFAAVLAIFLLVPRFGRFLEGYPLGRSLRLVVAVSAACGLATAPIAWLQFHSVQLLTVPANALAAPAVAPLLGLALGAAAIAPFSSSAAAALAWLNGWCAAYLVAVARLVGGLPIAQIKSTRALLVLLAGALLAAAYACPPRWRQS
ncbi:MAG: ComEC/Rec2 family competence protein [Actinomycetota bacterium]|nr:ComEC/Rec2 family competence protein [Actinomycetota bacterium]